MIKYQRLPTFLSKAWMRIDKDLFKMLMNFNYDFILKSAYGNKERSATEMRECFRKYYNKRSNLVCRSRAKSCLQIIRKLENREFK